MAHSIGSCRTLQPAVRHKTLQGEEGRFVGRVDRWQNLVNGAFRLAEDGDLQGAIAYLDNVLDVFPAETDPVDDFEGYAVRRMALALRDVMLQERERG